MAESTRNVHQGESDTSHSSPSLPIAERRSMETSASSIEDTESIGFQSRGTAPPTKAAAGDTRETWSHSQTERKPPRREPAQGGYAFDRLITADDVAERLNVSKDWVWDHSSRKSPRLPVIRMGDGALRYRASAIEAFISERERLSAQRYGSR